MIKTITWIIDWILRISGILTPIYIILVHFDIVPGYEYEPHKINSIVPIVNLFPGQKIQLDFDVYGNVYRKDIITAEWKITKNFKNYGHSDELTPTFVLPLPKGGIYQLSLLATTKDGVKIMGSSSLHVIETIPITMKPCHLTQVEITTNNTNPTLLKKIKTNGVEVYSEDGKWKPVQSTSFSEDTAIIRLQSNDSITTFNDQILFRAKAPSNHLTDYGSAHIQPKICP